MIEHLPKEADRVFRDVSARAAPEHSSPQYNLRHDLAYNEMEMTKEQNYEIFFIYFFPAEEFWA